MASPIFQDQPSWRPFVEALVASDSHSVIPPGSRIFDALIGSWDLLVRWFDAHGDLVREERGEWHFAHVLEGRGVQDVWIVPPRESRGGPSDYEYGASLRFYDPSLGVWRSTWIGPMNGQVRTFLAKAVGEMIVLETATDDSPRLRWSFSDLSGDGFSWRNEAYEAGHWRTQQTFAAVRRTVAADHRRKV